MKYQFRTMLFLAVSAVGVWIMSCSKSGGDADDGNTPYVILDLHAVVTTDSSVTLSWTATGDDSNSGTASAYDLRYARSWLNAASWDSAVKVTGEPSPREAGQAETLAVYGLEKDSCYYFTLNAADEAGNWSGLSNCAVASCFIDIVVTFPDPHLEACVRTMLAKPTGDIHRSDMTTLTGTLDGNFAQIKSLEGLEYATNLVELFLANDTVSDLGPIAPLTKLVNLQLAHNSISDISPLAGLTRLRGLILGVNQISNLDALSGMDQLHILMLDNNQISDLSGLVANTGLATADTVFLNVNPLSQKALNTDIPALEARGVTVIH